ncbi:hypothetical protein GJ496_004858 [Pomphorhynchus laevis]|nr:hypothetical protein GJ496_004858 [Pomphorhynchus laevis]
MRNLNISKRTKSLAHAQYLRFCLLNRLTTKGIKINKSTEVNFNLVRPTQTQKYQSEWNDILRCTEQALTYPVDSCTYSSLLSSKYHKLSYLYGRTVYSAELRSMDLKSNRRFRKPFRNAPVVNISSKAITESQLNALSLGMSFASMPREFNRLKMIDGLRYMANKIYPRAPELATNDDKLKFLDCNSIQKYVNLPPNFNSQKNMSKEVRDALIELRDRDDLVICPVDKGSKTLIWYKKDCIDEGLR